MRVHVIFFIQNPVSAQEQQQIAQVSSPPSYDHVVHHNANYPVMGASAASGQGAAAPAPPSTSGASASGAAGNQEGHLPSYNEARVRNPSATVSYSRQTPERVSMNTVL